MVTQYKNRCGQIYYFYQAITKKGRVMYYSSTKFKENNLSAIPDAYEIYENPNAQVFLVKKTPKLITDIEKQWVISALKKNDDVEFFLVDVRGKYITIYTAESSLPTDEFPYFPFEHFLNYMGKMRFKLVDEKTRYFTAERFCYLGAVDDWIGVGLPDRLEKLLKKYLVHLGQESFYQLLF